MSQDAGPSAPKTIYWKSALSESPPSIRSIDANPDGLGKIFIPTDDPVELTQHVQNLKTLRQDQANIASTAEFGSRKHQRALRDAEGLDRQIRFFQPYILDDDQLPMLIETKREKRKAEAPSDIKKGLAWFLISGAISLMGLLLAEPGQSYYIFRGAIIFGAFIFLRGVGKKYEWW